MDKAIFLDRDGTLIEDIGNAHKTEDFHILQGVIEGLKRLQKGEYVFFIITNQPGIGKGIFPTEAFHRFNGLLTTTLLQNNIRILRTCMCPHINGCECKKPSTKFINELAFEFKIDLGQSWVIGDHPSDIIMGNNAGCKTAYLLTGHGAKHLPELEQKKIQPTITSKNFLEAAERILSH